jgi:hypothetical protein
MTPPSTTAATLAGIRAGAEARAALGQAAHHELTPDGRHQVSIFDRAAGRLLVGTGATLAEAIGQVRGEHGGP